MVQGSLSLSIVVIPVTLDTYVHPESVFSKQVYQRGMITPTLSHFLTVRKKMLEHMGIL